jgi:hypothetical protein
MLNGSDIMKNTIKHYTVEPTETNETFEVTLYEDFNEVSRCSVAKDDLSSVVAKVESDGYEYHLTDKQEVMSPEWLC